MSNQEQANVTCPDVITLDQLPVKTPAVVVRVAEDHPELARLKVMGVCEGRPIHCIRQGSRLVVGCAGTHIGLTANLAKLIEVRLAEQTCQSEANAPTES